jgi:hypothetical protein
MWISPDDCLSQLQRDHAIAALRSGKDERRIDRKPDADVTADTTGYRLDVDFA